MTKYVVEIVCCILYIGVVKSAPPTDLRKYIIVFIIHIIFGKKKKKMPLDIK